MLNKRIISIPIAPFPRQFFGKIKDDDMEKQNS